MKIIHSKKIFIQAKNGLSPRAHTQAHLPQTTSVSFYVVFSNAQVKTVSSFYKNILKSTEIFCPLENFLPELEIKLSTMIPDYAPSHWVPAVKDRDLPLVLVF